MTLQATFAATLVDEWARAGLTDAVVSPGSRSTPLALALVRRPEIRTHVVLDERSAGFFALGLGMATARPAVVLTTSGTAAAELHPAVVEAHHARVPFLVCTADRPPDLHSVSAPQTILQARIFGDATRWSAEPGIAEAIPPASWRSLASRAWAETVANVAGPGPVHLNLAFRDPLVAEPSELPAARPDGRTWHVAERPASPPRRDLAGELNGRRGVIVAGHRAGRSTLRHLAEALEWPVFADARSMCRGWPGSVAAFDSLLRTPGFPPACEVETVLRLGEPPASKVLSQWLSSVEAEQIVIDPYGRWPDPERRADRVIHCDPTRFCSELLDAVHPAPDRWLEPWLVAERKAQAAIDEVLGRHTEATEPGVARSLTSGLDDEVALFASSSMPIRDLEWYGHPTSARRVYSNRGANGIDGVVSAALGVSAALREPLIALLGDLAFLHDAGGLLGASGRGGTCVFVVVDNCGGGIFSFLPQATSLPTDQFERLFATPHDVDLPALAAVHGMHAETVDTMADVLPAVAVALKRGGAGLVHVRTERAANVAVHEELNAAVAARIAS